MAKKCETEHCPRFGRENSSHGLCGPCYSGMYYWQKKKSVKDVMERKAQLRILSARLDNLRPANVHELRARKRA